MRGACHGFSFALVLGAVVAAQPALAQKAGKAMDGNGSHLDSLIAKHATAHNVPEALVRRVIKRESGGNPRAISKGNYGLMQIRLGTARALGYRGDVAGLLDADTNMTYAVKYLAGAYRVADGNADRAVRYYAAGYYYHAKRKGVTMPAASTVVATAAAEAPLAARAEAAAEPEDNAPVEAASFRDETFINMR
ncbi:MAG TPA: lytic transglycosylase domain-containing protein [Pseudolabrys sp.]|nr:lytic transglycosylase domain-containing protein [Pseudolabrys sp.]